jgi:hypothetical protein
MKIHSDILTVADLHTALRKPTPIDHAYLMLEACGSRSRKFGYHVSLYSDDETRPRKNSGRWGADDGYERSVSWDDWGIWMTRLFDIDPDAIIGNYVGEFDFLQKTSQVRDQVRESWKPKHKRYQEHMAPWLNT